jgi:hypothetical protein
LSAAWVVARSSAVPEAESAGWGAGSSGAEVVASGVLCGLADPRATWPPAYLSTGSAGARRSLGGAAGPLVVSPSKTPGASGPGRGAGSSVGTGRRRTGARRRLLGRHRARIRRRLRARREHGPDRSRTSPVRLDGIDGRRGLRGVDCRAGLLLSGCRTDYGRAQHHDRSRDDRGMLQRIPHAPV